MISTPVSPDSNQNVHDLHFGEFTKGSPENKPARNGPTSAQTEIKIAYIGGGSREWAAKLIGDLALTPHLTGCIALYDIDLPAARHNEKLAAEIFSHPMAQTKFSVIAESSLKEALRGADFVMISIEPGPTTLRQADLDIPARYGILQTVGDTTGPGGLLRGLRSVPILREFARAIMEHCPKAWVINYTNPMALCTAALFADTPEIKAFGCCHEVFGVQKRIAGLVEKWFHVSQPGREEIRLDIAGVNHFTWATRASWNGHDLMPRLHGMVLDNELFQSRKAEAETARNSEQWFINHGLVSYDLLRRFGALGAAGDRHLVEFVPWYLSSEEELHRWGIIRTPYSWRYRRSQVPSAPLGVAHKQPLKPSGEESVQQIEALLGLAPMITNVNLPNKGQLPGFPADAIVETYAEFGHNILRPLVANALPTGAACFVRRAIDEQLLTLHAALDCDRDLALQAMLIHPLVDIPMEKACAMLDEMIEATRTMLPGWK